uniref:Uncharacterized protein n=1 Tax=Arundo donax TaxID=35708 RepID=A0A0A9G9Q3_ARUDO
MSYRNSNSLWKGKRIKQWM